MPLLAFAGTPGDADDGLPDFCEASNAAAVSPAN